MPQFSHLSVMLLQCSFISFLSRTGPKNTAGWALEKS